MRSINIEGVEVSKHTTHTENTPSIESVGVLRRLQLEEKLKGNQKLKSYSMVGGNARLAFAYLLIMFIYV